MTPVEKLRRLGLALPEMPRAQGVYLPWVRTGSLVFVSGQLPWREGSMAVTGRLGENVSLEQGRDAARLCILNMMAVMEANGLSLDSITRVVQVQGFVQSAPGFHAQPQVLNGASELLAEVFGEAGRHARLAVGVAALPLDAAVEIAAVFEVL